MFSGRSAKARRVLNRIGIQVAGRNRLGVDFWHDFSRLAIAPGVIFDVGANVGQWAGECRLAYPTATIHSFEPEPTAFESLRERFSGDSRHQAHQMALSHASGTGCLRLSKYPMMHSLEPGFNEDAMGSVSVPTATLDEMRNNLGIDRIALLKIDIEGHEIPCLQGAATSFALGKIDACFIEAGFLGGVHTPFSDLEKILFEHNLHFLSLYDIVPRGTEPRVFYCNALFVRQGIAFSSR